MSTNSIDKEAIRKILRSYYNLVLEWTTKQLEAGNAAEVIAHAEEYQRKLDEHSINQIQDLIKADRQALVEKIGELRKDPDKFQSTLSGVSIFPAYYTGYNQALSDVIKLLKEEK